MVMAVRRNHWPVLLTALLLLLPLLPLDSSAQTNPPGSGFWFVNDTTVVSDSVVYLNGYLMVGVSGDLTLNNVTLIMNPPVGQRYIQVLGKMHVLKNSIIKGNNTIKYNFAVEPSGQLEYRNSTLRDVGWDWSNIGLIIRTSNVIFDNSTITDSFRGATLDPNYINLAPTFQNTNITNNTNEGIAGTNYPQAKVFGCNISKNGREGIYTDYATASFQIIGSRISGNYNGIYANHFSSPLILNNNITANGIGGGGGNGILLNDNSNPRIEGNNISDNKAHGISVGGPGMFPNSPQILKNRIEKNLDHGIIVYVTSAPTIDGNTVSGNFNGIGVRSQNGIRVANNTVKSNSNRGIDIYFSSPVVTGNDISYNGDGLYLDNSNPTITANTVYFNDNNGIFSKTSTGVIERTPFSGNGGAGIHAGTSSNLVVRNDLFNQNTYGIALDGSSIVQLTNSNFTGNTGLGIWGDQSTPVNLTWRIDQPVTVDGNPMLIPGPVTVASGGELYINDSAFKIGSTSAALHALEVQSGTKVRVTNTSSVQNNNTAYRFYFRVRQGASLEVRDSVIQGVGNAWGAQGETGGLFVDRASLAMANSEVKGGYAGLVVRGVSSTIESSLFYGSDSGTEVSAAAGSALTLMNSTVGSAGTSKISMDGTSLVDCTNTTLNNFTPNFGDAASILNVSWFVDILVQWQNGAPMPGAGVAIKDVGGRPLYSGATGADGRVKGLVVREYTQTQAKKDRFTPHRITITTAFLSFDRDLDINQSAEYVFEVVDNVRPSLLLLWPPDGLVQNTSLLNMSGRAWDNESGLAGVEATYDDGRRWFAANVSADGNWTLPLNFTADFVYTISVRALDFAGAETVLNVSVTVDTRAPALSLMTPAEGALLNTTEVVVSGKTERGAAVTVNGVATAVTFENFTATVPLPNEGENLLSVKASDAAGNWRAVERRVVRDTVPPPLRADSAIIYTTSNAVSLTGSTEPGAGVSSGESIGTVDDTGNFTIPVFIFGVDVTLTITAKDMAGNINSTTVRVVRDMVPPPLTTVPGDGTTTYTALRDFVITGTTEPGAAVTVGDITFPVDGKGAFNGSVALAEGPNSFEVVARDPARNLKKAFLVIVADWTPPRLAVSEPANGTTTKEGTVTVRGSTEAGANLTVNGVAVRPSSDGTFTTDVELKNGANEILVAATDRVGNRAAVRLVVTRQAPGGGGGGNDNPGGGPGIDTSTGAAPGELNLFAGEFSNYFLLLILLVVIAGVAAAAYSVYSARLPPPAAATKRRKDEEPELERVYRQKKDEELQKPELRSFAGERRTGIGGAVKYGAQADSYSPSASVATLYPSSYDKYGQESAAVTPPPAQPAEVIPVDAAVWEEPPVPKAEPAPQQPAYAAPPPPPAPVAPQPAPRPEAPAAPKPFSYEEEQTPKIADMLKALDKPTSPAPPPAPPPAQAAPPPPPPPKPAAPASPSPGESKQLETDIDAIMKRLKG